jgi:predicted phage terminase large subunit-like protein
LTSLLDLKPKQQKMLAHLQRKVVMDALVYSGGERALVSAVLALEKLPEEKRAAFGEQYVEYTRQLAKSDLYFLCAKVLDNEVVLDEFHKEMCDPSGYWDEKTGARVGASRELDLWPREHMKSTVLTEARAVQFILNDPDTRILIVNEILANSETFLQKIKRYFEKNDNLIFLFGDWVGPKWNADSMTVKTRKKNLKEPTVSIGALGHLPVSQHYDIIIADDVVGRSNVGTPDQMRKVEQFFSDLEDLLDKEHGLLSIIGTRWHYNDYYGKVMTLYVKHPRWRIRVHRIYRDDGSILFPKRFRQDVIEYLKLTKGIYDFNCQYMLEPVSAEDADFKNDWWEKARYEHGKHPEHLNVVITCDPASSNKASSDYTVYMVVGADSAGRWWIIDMVRARLDPQQRVDELFRLYAKWKFITPYIKVGIETVGFQQTMKFYTNEEMRQRSLFFQITDLKPKNAQKEDRIRSLVPRFANTMLMVPDRLMYNDEDMVGALKDEFLYFPKAKHDDMMDCLAYVNQVMPSFTGTLQSGVPSAFPLDWVSALIRGEIFWDDVQDQTGLGREEIEAYVRDAKQVGRH